jgi:N-acyl-D-amino-acid deacylase
MSRPKPFLLLFVLGVALFLLFSLHAQLSPPSFLIVNAQLIDGTGSPARKGNIRVAYNRIKEIGELTPAKGEPVIDAKGLVLAPGFIDIHNHSAEGIFHNPTADTQIAQGITSLVVGADGDSPWPIIHWVRSVQQLHAAPNISVFAGHATIREQVMGKDYKRVATPQEVQNMEQLLSQGMNQQAIGLSSGLEYEIGSYSDTSELVALAKVAASYGGIYMTHIRDETNKSFDALNEEIAIAERTHIAVEHSHIKLASVSVQGKAGEYVRVIDEARKRGVDFMADCYPYDAWHANLKVLVPDRQYENPKSVAKALADVGGASHVTIVEFKPNPTYIGHTIADLAENAHVSDVNMFVRLIREGDAAHTEAGIVCQSMIEADIKTFYLQPWVMVASDGGIAYDHPRGAGTFPRVLGVYVRQKHWLTLPEAVRKMTSLPAQRLGWKDRGVIQIGAYADLVLFDPDKVIDRSTYANPAALPAGIEKVFVNGVLVWDNDKPTGARPGLFLTLHGAPSAVTN